MAASLINKYILTDELFWKGCHTSKYISTSDQLNENQSYFSSIYIYSSLIHNCVFLRNKSCGFILCIPAWSFFEKMLQSHWWRSPCSCAQLPAAKGHWLRWLLRYYWCVLTCTRRKLLFSAVCRFFSYAGKWNIHLKYRGCMCFPIVFSVTH